jgi:hypothetical protein
LEQTEQADLFTVLPVFLLRKEIQQLPGLTVGEKMIRRAELKGKAE